MNAAADLATAPYEAPAGLAGVSVARTGVSDVLGRLGFYHYRGYNAVDIARRGRVEDAWYLLMRGELPTAEQRRRVRPRDRGAARAACRSCRAAARDRPAEPARVARVPAHCGLGRCAGHGLPAVD